MLGRPLLIAQLDAMHQSRGGDWFYRTFAPGRAMAELEGVYVVNLDQAHRRLGRVLEQADVLVINGVCSPDLLPVIQQRKLGLRLTVFEINDDVQEIQPSNPLAGFFGQPENIRLFRRLALAADAAQYSTPELERLYGALSQNGRVFPNQMVSVPPLRQRAGGAVNLGWGGSLGHYDDMAEVAPALCRFVLDHPQVTLHLMCADKIWRLFDALPADRKVLTPVGSIDDYYAFVSRLDIGIAPNQDKGFNRSRSDVKFLEYAAHGAVPLVQRLAPYANSVRQGDTGYFFRSIPELLQLLERLVADPSECARVRQSAHSYVSQERQQAGHAHERLEFYDELSAASVAGDAAGLFAELAALEGAEVSGRHVMLGHTRFESLLHDGLVQLQGGPGQHGADLLREAARLEPRHPLPELFLGAHQQSEPELQLTLRKNPRSVQAMLALGSLYLGQGQHRLALERFMAAAELAPGYEMPFAYAAQALEKLGAAKESAEFERIAQSLAQTVTPPPRPAPLAAATSGEAPAWHLLERGVHLETLDRDYAPTGLLEQIEPAPRRVLDVGCFCGGTGRWLKRRFPGCQVVGIEMLPEAAAIAAEAYDRVLVGTLEQVDLEQQGEQQELRAGSFDAIVAADVLEHMYNPWQALLRLKPLLAPGGVLYVSLPNARNLRLLADLARGNFDYAGSGILDVTHIRFFTRATATAMLEQTGFVVQDVRMNPDSRLAAAYEGKNLNELTSIELDGISLSGLDNRDLLELAALQLYLRATPG